VARTRTTKKLAQRIDLNYFKRPTPLKRAKFWLSLFLPLLALLWIAERTVFKDCRVYSSGRLSEPHAVLEKECAACHLQKAAAFSAKASSSACLDCHDGPVHHADKTPTPECSTCHTEHRGRKNILAASNQACAECHADLKAGDGSARFASHIRNFEDGHPEFVALRAVAGTAAGGPGTIKLNHALHLKPIRRGPQGPTVQLECSDCHRSAAVHLSWPYADPEQLNYYPTYLRKISIDDTFGIAPITPKPSRLSSGREYMAPVKFATACAGCHSLAFDERFEGGVPHDKPEEIGPFLSRKFWTYITAHPNELRERQNPYRDLAGKPSLAKNRVLTADQWVAERIAVSEELLWHKTCAQCHSLTMTPLADTSLARWDGATVTSLRRPTSVAAKPLPASSGPLPIIKPAYVTERWFKHARFDHDAHRGFACVNCHQKALTSMEASDVLIPGIAICKTCHAPGPEHAESRCFECHTYHDWSKRKEVTPKFTLPALRTGGR
jgi:hypothetical protein